MRITTLVLSVSLMAASFNASSQSAPAPSPAPTPTPSPSPTPSPPPPTDNQNPFDPNNKEGKNPEVYYCSPEEVEAGDPRCVADWLP
jgi:hypothetical protein